MVEVRRKPDGGEMLAIFQDGSEKKPRKRGILHFPRHNVVHHMIMRTRYLGVQVYNGAQTKTQITHWLKDIAFPGRIQ